MYYCRYTLLYPLVGSPFITPYDGSRLNMLLDNGEQGACIMAGNQLHYSYGAGSWLVSTIPKIHLSLAGARSLRCCKINGPTDFGFKKGFVPRVTLGTTAKPRVTLGTILHQLRCAYLTTAHAGWTAIKCASNR